MKKQHFGRALLACVLTVFMLFGTCATSFASVVTEEEVAYVQRIVDDAKAEIQNIIDIAQNGTWAEKEEKAEEYIAAAKNALITAGFDSDKIDEIEAAIRAEVAEIVAIASAGDVAAAEDKADAYIAYFKSLFDLTAEEDAFVDDVVDKVKDEIA